MYRSVLGKKSSIETDNLPFGISRQSLSSDCLRRICTICGRSCTCNGGDYVTEVNTCYSQKSLVHIMWWAKIWNNI